MKKVLRVAVAGCVLVALYFATGYGLAAKEAAECEELAFREAVAKEIRGIDFQGNTVPVERASFTTSISPFAVEVAYSVPRDLHATVFRKHFRISLSGQVTAGRLTVVYLV